MGTIINVNSSNTEDYNEAVKKAQESNKRKISQIIENLKNKGVNLKSTPAPAPTPQKRGGCGCKRKKT